MKMKTVTIHNWDGSKYDVEAPRNAKWVGIFNCTGDIRFFSRQPMLRGAYYDDQHMIKEWGDCGFSEKKCPQENLPVHDGYGSAVSGFPQLELLLKIEEV